MSDADARILAISQAAVIVRLNEKWLQRQARKHDQERLLPDIGEFMAAVVETAAYTSRDLVEIPDDVSGLDG